MAISPKAIKLERISEVKARLAVCSSILSTLKEDLVDIDLDEDLLLDFDSAESRINYLKDYVSDAQRDLRVTIAEFNQKLPNDRRNAK